MMKSIKIGFCALVALLALNSCKKDDNTSVEVTPPRDRGEVQAESDDNIMAYLTTHFYNYDEFADPSADFDYKIRFDTISGDNKDKIPLIDSVKVADYTFEDVNYKLYTLVVRKGEGKQATYADSIFLNYRGNVLGVKDRFDETINPVWFDLGGNFNVNIGSVQGTIFGFDNGANYFKGASQVSQNDDGTLAFSNDYGIGAVFIPSGLGYFNNTQANIPAYSSLVFQFYVYNAVPNTDNDQDGVPNIVEDLNGNNTLKDDDTDGDGLVNFVDVDDDNDGVPTSVEIEIKEDGTIVYTDTDGDGVPNYLDDDDDGDGRPTRDELRLNSSGGIISIPDSNDDGIPDYLDKNF